LADDIVSNNDITTELINNIDLSIKIDSQPPITLECIEQIKGIFHASWISAITKAALDITMKTKYHGLYDEEEWKQAEHITQLSSSPLSILLQ
jgi:hypothetical protein